MKHAMVVLGALITLILAADVPFHADAATAIPFNITVVRCVATSDGLIVVNGYSSDTGALVGTGTQCGITLAHLRNAGYGFKAVTQIDSGQVYLLCRTNTSPPSPSC